MFGYRSPPEQKLAAPTPSVGRPPAPPRMHLQVSGKQNGRGNKNSRTQTRRPKAGGSRSRNKARRPPDIGDYSLRDAAELAGSVIRGGIKIATTLFNVEEKVLDVTNTGLTILDGAPHVQCLNAIAEGTDYNTRDGNSIKVRNIYLNMYAQANATAGTNFLRVLVFQDLEGVGSTPTIGSLLEATGSGALVAHYGHYLSDRYRVLMDEHISVTLNNKALYQRYALPIDSHCLYQGTDASVASTYNGSLWIIITSDQATNGPALSYSARLTYVDN